MQTKSIDERVAEFTHKVRTLYKRYRALPNGTKLKTISRSEAVRLGNAKNGAAGLLGLMSVWESVSPKIEAAYHALGMEWQPITEPTTLPNVGERVLPLNQSPVSLDIAQTMFEAMSRIKAQKEGGEHV